MKDTMLELGVDSIYGDSMSNSVTVLAAEEGLLEPPLHRRKGMPFRSLHTETAERIDRNNLRKILFIFDALYDKRHSPSSHSSLFEHIERGMFDMEAYKVKTSSITLTYYFVILPSRFYIIVVTNDCQGAGSREQYEMYLAFIGLSVWLRTQFGQDLGRLSVDQWKGWTGIHNPKYKIHGGMNSLVSPLLRQLPQGSIEFCKPVDCVR
jgi:hypothetical protein